jgi:hypothetical protein
LRFPITHEAENLSQQSSYRLSPKYRRRHNASERLCEQTSIAWSLIKRTINDLAEALLSGIDGVYAEVADKGFAIDGTQLATHLKSEVFARASF